MDRIDVLTPEQIAAMPVWRDRWIKIGLSTEPADRAAAEQALRACYRFANLPVDELEIRWVRSPAEMAASVGASVGDSVRASVGASVWASVWASVGDSVRASVGASVWASVGASVWASVWASVGASVGASVRASVGASVWASVGASVGASVRASVWASVGDSYMGGQFYAYWAAYESFFRKVCDLSLPGDLAERAEAYATLIASVGPVMLFRKVAILCERPAAIRLEAGRLHGPMSAAVEWRDGTGIYAWRGTVIPKEWITAPNTLDPATVLTWPNAEQRRCAAEIVGWDRLLASVPHRIVNIDPDPEIGTLIHADLPDSPRSAFLRVRCGTGRQFAIPVPAEMRTAREANGWSYGLPAIEYQPEVRT